ncbi:MAG TPA: type II secretion system protein [Fimbriimonadaceae bacterium]|nr:type II secretion system protein [Fimbriimonadaceae bacterium]
MNHSHRSGLSLIQFLVVISILAVLLAIAFPVMRAARERSEVAGCHSNLKQLGMATLQYATENDQMLFPRMNFIEKHLPHDTFSKKHGWMRAGDPVGWHRATNAYAKSREIFFCASAKTPAQRNTLSPIELPGSITGMLTTYRTTIKFYYEALKRKEDGFFRVNITQLTEPSRELYLGDVMWLKPNAEKMPNHRTGMTFHGEKANMFYLDGSVQFRFLWDQNFAPPQRSFEFEGQE